MVITAAVMVGVAGWRGYLNRHKKDETMLKAQPESRQWTEAGVFAYLVELVYCRDKGRENLESLLYDLNYKPVNDFSYPSERLMVFGRVGDGPSSSNAVRWPKYVVAIRGTIISSHSDQSEDLRILLQSLSPSIYKPVIKLLKELHGRCPGPDGVCVVGHSLGAAIALIATADLAIDHNIVLDTYLFNPPYFTLGVLLEKVVNGMASGLADGATNILGIDDAWGRRFRDVAKCSINKVKKVAGAVGAALAPGTYVELWTRYETLRSQEYRPNIYLNQHDPISNGYIEHFKRSAPRVSIAVLIWKNFVSHCESLHLIPQARVQTNHYACEHVHDLEQWWRYESVNLTSRDAGAHFCSSISEIESELVGVGRFWWEYFTD